MAPMDGLQRLKQMEEFETWTLWENIIATILEHVFFGWLLRPCSFSCLTVTVSKSVAIGPIGAMFSSAMDFFWTGRLEV